MQKSYRALAVAIMTMVMLLCASVAAFADEPEWKPTENKDKFEGITCGRGMFSAAAKGTEIVINNDGTVTLNVTTVPMTSTKYPKVAFSMTEMKDDAALDAAAETIPVTVGTAIDEYVGQFDGVNYGEKPYYWSCFSYTIQVEDIVKPIYTAGYNVLKKTSDETKTYEEDLSVAQWAYKSTWTINATPELIAQLRSKQAELGDSEIAQRIGAVADVLEAAVVEQVRVAIEAAKADLTNKELLEVAIAAYEKLSDADKATFADDIKIISDAKAEIERKEAIDAAIKKVKAGKISSFKVKAGKKKATFTWKKNTTFAGYQLKYKVGKKTKTVNIKSAKTVKKVIKKLKKKQKVSGQIRGYKKISGTTYYGKWAKSKTVKVK